MEVRADDTCNDLEEMSAKGTGKAILGSTYACTDDFGHAHRDGEDAGGDRHLGHFHGLPLVRLGGVVSQSNTDERHLRRPMRLRKITVMGRILGL